MGWAGAADGRRLLAFHPVGALGIILGGRAGYVLFYNPGYFAAHPWEALQLWKGGMSFHGGFLGCVLAVVLFARYRRPRPVARRRDLRGRADRDLSRPHRQFHQRRAVGAADRRALGDGIPERRPAAAPPSQLYEALLEGLVLLAVLAALMRAGALKRPGFITGAFALGYGAARLICELFREPDPQLGFLWGGLTMGMLLSLPLMLAGIAFMAWAMRHEPARRA